jgi:hypothetical protein
MSIENKLIKDFKVIIECTENQSDTSAYLVAACIFKNYFEDKQKEGLKEIDVAHLIELCNEIRALSDNRMDAVRELQKQAQIRFEESVERVTKRYQELYGIKFESHK